MYQNYQTVFLGSLLTLFSFAQGVDLRRSKMQREKCMREVAIQCPRFWGLAQSATYRDDLSTMDILAGIRKVLDSCPVIRCVSKVSTKYEKCVAGIVLDSNLIKKPDPSLSDMKRQIELKNILVNAKDRCSTSIIKESK